MNKRNLKKYNPGYNFGDTSGKNNGMFGVHRYGKDASNYKDGRRSKIYHCIERRCNNEINYKNWLCGNRRCRSCSKKGKRSGRYIDGRSSKKNYCIDCLKKEIKKEINYWSKRCVIHANEEHSKTMKKKWENKKYREKSIRLIMKGSRIKPNKPEKLLNKVLQKILPKEYKINVKANTMILVGKIPDFVNVNGQKKIIELYGDYWHNISGRKESDKRRIKLFKKFGYKALVIWQHELKDLDKVTGKILAFNQEK